MERLLVELVPCLLLGLLLGRLRPSLAPQWAPLLLGWGMPLSLTALILRAGFRPGTAEVGLVTLVVCGGGLLLTRFSPALRERLPSRSLQLGAVVGNTAYVGLPVALALLPPEALAFTITVDFVGTLVTWTLGPLLLAGAGVGGPPGLLRLVLATPTCRAVAAAVPIALTPWSGALAELLWWPARLTLWALLVLVGMRLAPLLHQPSPSAPPFRWGQLLPPLALKLVILPALVWPLVALLGLQADAADAVVLQAAMPTAMSVLLLAEASRADDRNHEVVLAARLVLVSTLMALFTIPMWWWLLSHHPWT